MVIYLANDNNNNNLKSLAPSNMINEVESYIERLNEVIQNDSFGNIAVTGDLGIGKSSLIRTFERQKKYKFIYLSASDLGYRVDKIEFNHTEEIQSKLEKDLLVQLVSLCKRSDIPNSRFRTVPESESRSSRFLRFFYSIICGISVLCGGKLIANHFVTDKDYLPIINFVPWQWGMLLAFLGVTVGAGIYRLLTNYKLSKLSVGKEESYSASAEIDSKALEPEALDTNLHEILYLFERIASKKSNKHKKSMPVFIIEDLDRYRSDICIPILTKLKQINNMLNNRYRNQHDDYGMHFKFIYLLNDRIFDISENCLDSTSEAPYNYEDSTYKFFDVIIPVLPKLGFTNSSEEIKTCFGPSIDQNFIDEICCYVYDYRKLNDIENEFNIYKERFKDKNNITPTKLLAFVIYKVFYKKKYDQLYKAENGDPINDLLKYLLMPDIYQKSERNVDHFERILENYFQDVLFDILQMTEAVKNKYKSTIIATTPDDDYSGGNLSNIDLSGTDLHGRNFAGSDLRDAILIGTNLRGANLSGAILSNADMSGADLRGTNLIAANLSDAKLSSANLSSAILKNANLENVIFENANLTKSKMMGTSLFGANLTGAMLKSANLQNAKYDSFTIFPEGYSMNSRGMRFFKADPLVHMYPSSNIIKIETNNNDT